MARKIIVLILLLSVVCVAGTEEKIYNAGGKWLFRISEDKLTGAQYGVFELKADEPVADGLSNGVPSFIIMCGGSKQSPKWVNSKLVSPVVLGLGDTRSAFGVPQQFVRLRADDKIHVHAWNIADDFHVLFVDKGATKELLGSSSARIQFTDASGHAQVAMFSPAGIRNIEVACGAALK